MAGDILNESVRFNNDGFVIADEQASLRVAGASELTSVSTQLQMFENEDNCTDHQDHRLWCSDSRC